MTLRDLPRGWHPPNETFINMLRYAFAVDAPDEPVRVHRGVYLAHINFDKEIEDLVVGRYPDFAGFPADGEWFGAYGVVDHWTQLPLKILDDDPRDLLVYLGRYAKADQPDAGGWRWHKWGPYLGVFQEQVAANEYLYDTPDVVEVWTYHVVEVKTWPSSDR